VDRYVQLVEEREQLWMAYFCDPSRPAGPAAPPEPQLRQLEQALGRDEVYVAPHLAGEELYFLVVRRGHSRVLAAPSPTRLLREHLQEWRCQVAEQLDGLNRGQLPGPAERVVLDDILARLG